MVEASAKGNYRPLAASPSPSCSRRLSGSARSVEFPVLPSQTVDISDVPFSLSGYACPEQLRRSGTWCSPPERRSLAVASNRPSPTSGIRVGECGTSGRFGYLARAEDRAMLESNMSADLGAGNRGGTYVCASFYAFGTASGPASMRKTHDARSRISPNPADHTKAGRPKL
jgi:hypothetical protein